MDKIIKNPFCYHGSKARILPLIQQNLPPRFNTLIDIMGGSGEVALNIEADRVLYNEKNKYICGLLRTIKEMPADTLFDSIEQIIDLWGLTKDNKKAFINFRQNFNELSVKFLFDTSDVLRWEANLHLLVLCFYSFNHQIIFNKSGKFSVPAGTHRSCYNKSIMEKLFQYKQKIDSFGSELQLYNYDWFEFLNTVDLDIPNTLLFVDPPYLLSDSALERTPDLKWSVKQEQLLYEILKKWDSRGGRFMLTNLLKSKGVINEYLLTFSKNYVTINTDVGFGNCSYQRKNRQGDIEVIVKNY